MKKLLVLVLALVLVVSLAGCKDEDNANSGKQKVIIGLDDSFPPMGFKDDKGELTGFDVEMAREAAKLMDVEVVFQPIDWSAKELELKSKKVDLLWNGVTITDERKENWGFSKPYLKNKQIILVKKDSSIKKKADLAGKTVGVQKESSAVSAIENFPDVKKSLKELNEYKDNISAFSDLKVGRVDAVVVDEIVARYYLAQNKTDFAILEGDNFGDEQYGVAMRKDDTELNEKLQKALDEMNKNGKAAEISEKWFGKDIVIK